MPPHSSNKKERKRKDGKKAAKRVTHALEQKGHPPWIPQEKWHEVVNQWKEQELPRHQPRWSSLGTQFGLGTDQSSPQQGEALATEILKDIKRAEMGVLAKFCMENGIAAPPWGVQISMLHYSLGGAIVAFSTR